MGNLSFFVCVCRWVGLLPLSLGVSLFLVSFFSVSCFMFSPPSFCAPLLECVFSFPSSSSLLFALACPFPFSLLFPLFSQLCLCE